MPRFHWKPSREIACAFGLVLSTGFFVQADEEQKPAADKQPAITVTVEAKTSDEAPAKKAAQADAKKESAATSVSSKAQKTITATVSEAVTEKVVDGVPQKVQIRIQKSTEGDGTEPSRAVVQKQGKIVVVGPDGKTHAFEFQGDKIPDLNELIGKQQLSDEVRERISQALKKVDGVLVNPAATTLEAQVVRIQKDDSAADGSKAKDGKTIEWREAQVIHVDEDGQSIRIIRQPGNQLIRVEPVRVGVPFEAGSKIFKNTAEGVYKIELHGDVKADHKGYVIGIQCAAEMPASLDAQLNLKGKGVLVESVIEESPAATAGIQAFDVVVAVGDTVIDSVASLQSAINEAGASKESVKLTVLRNGKKQSVAVQPRQVKHDANSFVIKSVDGMSLSKLSDPMMQKLKDSGEVKIFIAQPGFVFKSEGLSEEQQQKLKKAMEQLKSEHMQSMHQLKMMQPMVKAIPATPLLPGHVQQTAEMAKQLESLKKQVAELQQTIKKMQAQSKLPSADDKKPVREKKADRDKSATQE